MSAFETWRKKLAARAEGESSPAPRPAPVVVDISDPRRAMREAGWGGEDATASSEPPGTGVGRGSRVAEAVAGEGWQAERVAEAKRAKGKRRAR